MMDITKQFYQQQCGNAKWKNYDSFIKRLRCPIEDEHTQLLPSEDVICDTPIFACKFAQQKNHESLLALANEDGKLAINDTSKQQESYGIRAHNNAIFDLAWMFENMKIVTASGDHTAKLFDVSSNDVREIQQFRAHTRSVKTVAFRKNDFHVFASGGRDGNIIVWDTRVSVGNYIGKFDRTIVNSHSTKSTPSRTKKRCTCANPVSSSCKSVTGLVFQDDYSLISCGAGDGVIKVWDLRKNYQFSKLEPLPKYKIPYAGTTTKNGFSGLTIDKDSLTLYANCLDNTIYSYNIATYNYEPIRRYVGHQNNTFYIKSALSRDGLYLISGSSDENAYIWNTKHSTPIVKLTGHVAEVTCVAWCEKDEVTLVTCSDDMSHRIWRIGPEELPDNWEVLGKGKAEVLPISSKSKLKRPVDSVITPSKKVALFCQKCDSPAASEYCQNCFGTKRRQQDELSNETKRFHSESGPRRLFHNILDNNESDELATDLDDSRKVFNFNLPNYVIDGIAPHLNFSPPKRKDQDWLTKFRIERKLKRDFVDGASTSTSPKVPKLELTPKKTTNLGSPILKYFKVKCEGHGCQSKAMPGSSVMTSSPKSSQ